MLPRPPGLLLSVIGPVDLQAFDPGSREQAVKAARAAHLGVVANQDLAPLIVFLARPDSPCSNKRERWNFSSVSPTQACDRYLAARYQTNRRILRR